MNNTPTYTDPGYLDDGDYGYTALIHEIGHALGLKHPGNYNAGGGGASPPYLPSSMDSRAFTTMSYSTPAGWTGTDASTMGYLDIAALQFLYGKGTNANQDFTFTDADQDVLKTIYATGNGNSVDLSTVSLAVDVDLRGGSFISIGRDFDNIGVAYGTDIDELYLGDGDAVVYGDADGVNVYRDDGDLTFTGGRGADRIILNSNATTRPLVSDGTLVGYDTFFNYDSINDTVVTDRLAASAGIFDGTDSSLMLGATNSAIRSHSISSDGVITFSTNDLFGDEQSLTSLADVATAIQYLQGNNLGDFKQVSFEATIDGVSNTFMFIQGRSTDNNTDYLIRLVEVESWYYDDSVGTSFSPRLAETASAASLAQVSRSQIYELNTSRAQVVQDLESVFSTLKASINAGFRNLANNPSGTDFGTLLAILERNVDSVAAQRSVIGALSNAAGAQIMALGTIANNLRDANSRIVDTDYASATAELTKAQILQQGFIAVASTHTDMSRQLIETLLQ